MFLVVNRSVCRVVPAVKPAPVPGSVYVCCVVPATKPVYTIPGMSRVHDLDQFGRMVDGPHELFIGLPRHWSTFFRGISRAVEVRVRVIGL